MKIDLEIDDRFSKHAIRIFAGVEIIARKWGPNQPWEIKTRSCSLCGKCCGDCGHLVFDGTEHRCDLGGNMPFSCCYSDGIDGGEKDCTIIWQE